MKQDWVVKTLGEVVNKGSSNVSLNKIKNDNGIYPVFGAKGFAKNVSFFQQGKEYLAIIKDGAGIGRVSKYPEKSSVLATMQYLIPKEGFDIGFIEYFLNTINFEKYRTGSTIPHIYFKDYKSERFPVLPLPEQKQIVKKLDACFNEINQAKTNLAQNLQNTKDLFQSALTQIFTNQGTDWRVKTLGEVCQVNPLKSEINIRKNMLVSFLPMKDLTVGKKIVTPNQEKEFEKVSTSYTYFAENDVILAKVTPCFENGKSGVVKNLTNGIGFGSSEYFVYRADLSAVIPEWIYYCISDQKFIGIGKLNMGGASGLQRLTKNFVTNYKIPTPSLVEQQQIAKKLDKLNQQTESLTNHYQNQLKSLETLKKSLLEKAFTGKLTANPKSLAKST